MKAQHSILFLAILCFFYGVPARAEAALGCSQRIASQVYSFQEQINFAAGSPLSELVELLHEHAWVPRWYRHPMRRGAFSIRVAKGRVFAWHFRRVAGVLPIPWRSPYSVAVRLSNDPAAYVDASQGRSLAPRITRHGLVLLGPDFEVQLVKDLTLEKQETEKRVLFDPTFYDGLPEELAERHRLARAGILEKIRAGFPTTAHAGESALLCNLQQYISAPDVAERLKTYREVGRDVRDFRTAK